MPDFLAILNTLNTKTKPSRLDPEELSDTLVQVRDVASTRKEPLYDNEEKETVPLTVIDDSLDNQTAEEVADSLELMYGEPVIGQQQEEDQLPLLEATEEEIDLTFEFDYEL